MVANALVIFCARWSKLPAQPTQKSTSGDLPSAKKSAAVLMVILLFLFPAKIHQMLN
jgi:hypothetical protein